MRLHLLRPAADHLHTEEGEPQPFSLPEPTYAGAAASHVGSFFALFSVRGALVHTVHRIHRRSLSRAGAQILALRSTLTPSNTLPQRTQRTGRPGLQSRLRARPLPVPMSRSAGALLVQRSRPAAVRLVRIHQPGPGFCESEYAGGAAARVLDDLVEDRVLSLLGLARIAVDHNRLPSRSYDPLVHRACCMFRKAKSPCTRGFISGRPTTRTEQNPMCVFSAHPS